MKSININQNQSQKKSSPKLPSLKKEDVQYKILVTEGLEEKIRTSCKLFKDKEWSGVLFYSVEGSFKENNISIKALDYFPMDIGSASYTEYDQSPEIVGYMVDNPELLGAKMGLIHSHNKMAKQFIYSIA